MYQYRGMNIPRMWSFPHANIELGFPQHYLPAFIETGEQHPLGELIGPLCTADGAVHAVAVLVHSAGRQRVVPTHAWDLAETSLPIPTAGLEWLTDRHLVAIRTPRSVATPHEARAVFAAWLTTSFR